MCSKLDCNMIQQMRENLSLLPQQQNKTLPTGNNTQTLKVLSSKLSCYKMARKKNKGYFSHRVRKVESLIMTFYTFMHLIIECNSFHKVKKIKLGEDIEWLRRVNLKSIFEGK